MDLTEHQFDSDKLIRRHLQFAWWSLLCYLSLGIALELLHAFKIGWYLDSSYEIRRLMWTLGHAHGTLLALVHAVFAMTMYILPGRISGLRRFASPCLMAASILLPNGFFLGGIFIHSGDPGVGIFLVPFGAVLMFVCVLLTACGTVSLTEVRSRTEPQRSGREKKSKTKRKRS